jgi:hypothetical protein
MVISEAKMGGISGYPALPIAGSPLKRYQRFLFWAAGAGRDFLQDCVEAEKFKYECIGALICLTATMASFSMFMAVWLTWQQDPWVSMLAPAIALLWGCLIFTIDRFMVSSLRADAAWSLRLGQALPRLILAVIIGIIISRPIEIKIFETEIMKVVNREIAQNQASIDERIKQADTRIGDLVAQPFQGRITGLNGEIDELRREKERLGDLLEERQGELDYWQREAEAEREGKAASGQPGEGPRYEEKLQRAAEYKKRVEETEAELKRVRDRLPEAESELRELEQAVGGSRDALPPERFVQRDALLKMQGDAGKTGFLELNLALRRLAQLPQFMPAAVAAGGGIPSAEDQREVASVVSLTLWGITLLFITIEVLPILTKLMAPAGQYDEKMQSAPYAAQMLSMQEMVAVARARTAFLEQYEHATSALYADAFERLKGDNGRTETLRGALWEHLRGGLNETLTRLRGYQSPFAPDRPELAETAGPAVVPAPRISKLPKPGSRLGGRVLVAVTTTILMFFVSYSYLKNQEIEFEAINAALAIAALAFPLLTTILLRRSSPER